MKKYDSIIVGSGMSGMTLALLLAKSGHKTLLLEKSPYIGGSLARFTRKNIAFDTGLHFLGGMQDGGIFNRTLKILQLEDAIKPIPMPHTKWIFEKEEEEYVLPSGVEEMREALKGYFPNETRAIDKYLQMSQYVCDNTSAMDLGDMDYMTHRLKEDFITLEDTLNGITANPMLKAIFSSFALCYGVKPSEVSFANHARICMNFYEGTWTVENGGDAFIKAFQEKFDELGVEVRCGTYIEELADIKDRLVGSFILNTKERITADNCVFTIHPWHVLKLFPEQSVSRAFRNRIGSFESSLGFFNVFAMLTEKPGECLGDCGVTSILPNSDINALLNPENKGEGAIAVSLATTRTKGENTIPMHILRSAFPNETARWEGTKRGSRPADYLEYKKRETARIMERYLKYFPERADKIKVVDSASLLTFKDYLNNPDGCAYGVKQRIGQFNLVGKLPFHNLYGAGQSSVLPGVLGAAMSSFIVARSVIGKEKYKVLFGANHGK